MEEKKAVNLSALSEQWKHIPIIPHITSKRQEHERFCTGKCRYCFKPNDVGKDLYLPDEITCVFIKKGKITQNQLVMRHHNPQIIYTVDSRTYEVNARRPDTYKVK